MWKIYFGLLVISFAGTLLGYKKWMEENTIRKHGTLVTVDVTQKDDCILANTIHYFRFIYDGKVHVGILNELYCDSFNQGSRINLIYMDDERFIFPKENSAGSKLMVIVGIVLTISFIYATIKTCREEAQKK